MHAASNTLKLAVSLSLAVTRINFVKVSQCYVYNVYYHHAADQLYVFGRVSGAGGQPFVYEREGTALRSNLEPLACDSVDCHPLVDDLMTFPPIVHKCVTFL